LTWNPQSEYLREQSASKLTDPTPSCARPAKQRIEKKELLQLNRKQKLIIASAASFFILSFLFPPWADYEFRNHDNEHLVIGFVGYNWLFNDAPSQYMYSYHWELKYSEEAEKVLSNRQQRAKRQEVLKELELKAEKLRQVAGIYEEIDKQKTFDPIDFWPQGYSKEQIDSIKALEAKLTEDSIMLEDSILSMGSSRVKVKDELRGVAAVYHDLLIIQVSVILVLSVALVLILK
jgi:hypothetical protein